MSRCLIHLPPSQAGLAHPQAAGFYGDLCRALQRSGWQVSFKMDRISDVKSDYAGDLFHIVHEGQIDRPNVLNTAPGPLRDFWYMDPLGTGEASAIAAASFDPITVPAHRARAFFERQQRRLVTQRQSKRPQPDLSQDFGQGHVAVFLGPEQASEAGDISDLQMVQALLQHLSGDRLVVKAHPEGQSGAVWHELRELAQDTPALQLVEANVHDVLNGASLCCSLGSSVSFEAMLHEVPSLVFLPVGFHHNVLTVTDLADLSALAAEARQKDWPNAEYLFWFLRQNCLDLTGKGWKDKAVERVEHAMQQLPQRAA